AMRIAVSRAAAQLAVSSGELAISLPGLATYPVRYERQETSERGDWTFVGRVETRLGPQAAVLTFGRDGVFGVLPAPEGHLLHVTTSHGETYVQRAGGLVPVGRPPGGVLDDVVRPPSPSAAPPTGEATAQ